MSNVTMWQYRVSSGILSPDGIVKNNKNYFLSLSLIKIEVRVFLVWKDWMDWM